MFMSNQSFGNKVLIDALSIATGIVVNAVAAFFTGGTSLAASPTIQKAVKTTIGTGINMTYQIIANGEFNGQTILNSAKYAASSIAIGSVLKGAKEVLGSSLDGVNKLSRTASQVRSISQFPNKPLTTLLRLKGMLKKQTLLQESTDLHSGISTSKDAIMKVQMEQTHDWLNSMGYDENSMEYQDAMKSFVEDSSQEESTENVDEEQKDDIYKEIVIKVFQKTIHKGVLS